MSVHRFYDRDGGTWEIQDQHFARMIGDECELYEPILCEEITRLVQVCRNQEAAIRQACRIGDIRLRNPKQEFWHVPGEPEPQRCEELAAWLAGEEPDAK